LSLVVGVCQVEYCTVTFLGYFHYLLDNFYTLYGPRLLCTILVDIMGIPEAGGQRPQMLFTF